MTAGRGAQHGRIAVRMEQAFRSDTTLVSAQLGGHFEAASDWWRAARDVGEAAATASRRGAVEEGAHGLARALALLARLPLSPHRQAEEARLRITLGATLMASEAGALRKSRRNTNALRRSAARRKRRGGDSRRNGGCGCSGGGVGNCPQRAN